MIFAREESFYALACDIRRLTFRLAPGSNLGVVHTRAVKKVSIRRARLQSGYRYAGLAQFIAEAMSKRQDESLGSRVYGFSRRHHLTGDRSREKDLSFTLTEHLLDNVLRQLHGACAVQFHHFQLIFQIRFCEQSAHSHASIDAGDVQGFSQRLYLIPQTSHAFACSKVGLNLQPLDGRGTKFLCCCLQTVATRGDDEIVSALSEFSCKKEPNPT